MSNGVESELKPRLCHILKWPDFQGYGFNLHAEKGKAGQFIGKVDDDSPASSAGLKSGDRIVEVNGVNIGNENHQQVVQRIKAGGEQTKLLVVDEETDKHYKEEKKVVRGDLPDVLHLRTALRPGQDEPPLMDTPTPQPEPPADNNNISDEYQPRLCHLRKWPDFQGYGFNLHAEKNKPGQYIGKVDEDSPAEKADLRENDRIIEVNGSNVEQEAHQHVITKIKESGDEAKLLVVDSKTDAYYKDKGIQVTGSLPQVRYCVTPYRALPDVITTEHVIDVHSERITSIEISEESIVTDTEPVTESSQDEVIPEEQSVPEIVEQTTTITENEHVYETADGVNDQIDETINRVDDIQGDAVVADLVQENNVIPDEVPEDIVIPPSDQDTVPMDTVVNAFENVTTNGTDHVESTVHETIVSETTHISETIPDPENGYTPSEPSIPEPVAEPPAPEPSSYSVDPTPAPAPSGDMRPEGMSAKEYMEYLKNKKKQDPRKQKLDFKQKYDMFQKM